MKRITQRILASFLFVFESFWPILLFAIGASFVIYGYSFVLSIPGQISEPTTVIVIGTPAPTPIASLTSVHYSTTTDTNGVTENSAILSLNSLGVGDLRVTSPTRINLREDAVIRLSIKPDTSLTALEVVAVPLQSSRPITFTYIFNDKITLYPIMRAEMVSSDSMQVISDGSPEKPILSDMPTEWVWTAKALRDGKHTLIIILSIPVAIDGREEELKAALRNIPIEMTVTKSFGHRVEELAPIGLPAFIGLLGVVITVMSNAQQKIREQKIKDLENRIINGESEREKLQQEINRLGKLPKWQFWRK